MSHKKYKLSKQKYEHIVREQRKIGLEMAKYLISSLKDINPNDLLDNDDFIFDYIFNFLIHFDITGYTKHEAFFHFFDVLHDYNIPLYYKMLKEKERDNNRLLLHAKKEEILKKLSTENLTLEDLQYFNQTLEQLQKLANKIEQIDTKELDVFFLFKKYWQL